MNFLPIITFAAVAVFLQVFAQDPKTGHSHQNRGIQQCLEQYSLDEATVKSGAVPDSKTCVYRCFKEKTGLMNAAGEVTLADFKAKHPSTSTQKLANWESCIGSSKKPDPCDTAKAITECMKLKRKQN